MNKQLVIFLTIFGFTTTASRGRAQSLCLTQDYLSTSEVEWAQRYVTSTDTAVTRVRAKVNLPYIASPDSVYLVTADTAICREAASAFQRQFAETPSDTLTISLVPVYVLKVGPTRYLVFNGKHVGPTGNDLLILFSATWTRLGYL